MLTGPEALPRRDNQFALATAFDQCLNATKGGKDRGLRRRGLLLLSRLRCLRLCLLFGCNPSHRAEARRWRWRRPLRDSILVLVLLSTAALRSLSRS